MGKKKKTSMQWIKNSHAIECSCSSCQEKLRNFYSTSPLFIMRLVCYNTANTDGTIAYEYKECREAWSAGPGTLL